MQKEACFYLGFITKKHGFKGDISIKLNGENITDYNNLEYIYIEINAQLIFYKIEHSCLQKDIFLKLKLEDVNNEQLAKDLIKRNVYVPKKDVTIKRNNIFFNFDIIGFIIQDKMQNNIGFIHEINTLSPQPILIVINEKKKEIMIPLVDDFIISVNKKNKIITVDLPIGLIDMNNI